jgi:lactate permease
MRAGRDSKRRRHAPAALVALRTGGEDAGAVILALQALPLLLLLALLGSGRVGPIGACLAALAATLPAALVSLPPAAAGGVAALLVAEVPRGLYLALQPVGVVAGGLLFHAAVARDGQAVSRPATAARVFAVTLPLGGFLESVTGFSVGAVFALTALRAMGLGGPVAAALALQALVLVPWGGLGPGTALGAALAGLPAQEVARVAAWPNAAWIVLLAPLLWWLMARAGLRVPMREKAVQLGLLAAVALLLLGAHAVLPFELAGLAATGPVLILALWRADPPQDPRAAVRSAAPYLLLTACLLSARGWDDPPALAPFPDLPALPLSHVAVVLWLVAGALLAARPGGMALGFGALRRAARPALAMLLYVVLGRMLAGSGIAASLAEAATAALGALAPYAVPVLALLSGLITGSNVGANAALMPLQSGLGEASGLPQALAPGVHNFAGAAGAGMSIGTVAMLCGLLADGTRPVQVWRLLLPSMALVLGLGWLTIAALR